jgi:hypothetical protein
LARIIRTFGKKMQPTRHSPPWSVQWACAILVAIPLFHCVDLFLLLPSAEFIRYAWMIPSGWVLLAYWASYACIGLGIAKGLSVFRWCFVALVVFGVMNAIRGHLVVISAPRFPHYHVVIISLSHWAVLVLCFLPSANRYFNSRKKPNQLPDPTSRSVTPPAKAGDAPSVAADH